MDNGGTNYGRESGTGQDTPKVCVHVSPRFPLRLAGHSVTMSRPVPLSRIWSSPSVPTGRCGTDGLALPLVLRRASFARVCATPDDLGGVLERHGRG
jgi:hypothetical protein